ncbi:MAG: type III-B CRISPR module RAMP protein Cmr1 [Candidatus Binatia bacterium]|nr:type III-B CRISPR module RAMP protein Cmr1 [Candidatus Binatia bacterium]
MTKVYTLKALTDIWTGDPNRSGDRATTTGLLGSIRWRFEVLVRGLGGKACDPTKHQCEGARHSVLCELFGCTGWARKFRFELLDGTGKVKATQIKQNQTFTLRFLELRPIQPVEWALLDLTLCLIAEYGAVGGKTVLKPSDEANRANAAHHRDYGLIQILKHPDDLKSLDRKQLGDYVQQPRKPAHDDFDWASLQNL